MSNTVTTTFPCGSPNIRPSSDARLDALPGRVSVAAKPIVVTGTGALMSGTNFEMDLENVGVVVLTEGEMLLEAVGLAVLDVVGVLLGVAELESVSDAVDCAAEAESVILTATVSEFVAV